MPIKDEMLMNKQKQAIWIYCENKYVQDGWQCSHCGFFVPWDYKTAVDDVISYYFYCPHCGSKMKRGA